MSNIGNPALVLNADYRPLSYYPLSLYSWQDTIKSVFLKRVSVIECYDKKVRSPSKTFKLPSVIALKDYIIPNRKPAFTRFNVFLRDNFTCQYCRKKFSANELTFDHHGREIKFPFKLNSKTTENYPNRLLEKNPSNVKNSELTHDDAIKKLQSFLKKPLVDEVRKLEEEFVLREISEVYVPIYEARLIGPKKKVGIIRIDSVRKKVL